MVTQVHSAARRLRTTWPHGSSVVALWTTASKPSVGVPPVSPINASTGKHRHTHIYCLLHLFNLIGLCDCRTFRSTAMQERELQYLKETKNAVYFAVGSYGSDPKRAGLCYRMKLKGVGIKSDIVMQVRSPLYLHYTTILRFQYIYVHGGL